MKPNNKELETMRSAAFQTWEVNTNLVFISYLLISIFISFGVFSLVLFIHLEGNLIIRFLLFIPIGALCYLWFKVSNIWDKYNLESKQERLILWRIRKEVD